jgi:hypothetical protein
MSTTLSPEALPWLQGLAMVLLVGLVLALVVGALLLARPQALFALNQRLSRWIDTRAALSLLDQPRHLERFFYRHHRALGISVVVGASYVLGQWAFAYDRGDVLALLGPNWARHGMDWVPAAFEVVLVGLHVAILVVGVVIVFRPSLLKGVEKTANRWQPGPATAPFDQVVGNLDDTFESHPRVSGFLLVVSATWCLLALAPTLADLLMR